MHSPFWSGGPKSKVSNRLFLIFNLCIEDFVFCPRSTKSSISENFFLKQVNMGVKIIQNFTLISDLKEGLQKKSPEKLDPKSRAF
jgi:hypothetical protein